MMKKYQATSGTGVASGLTALAMKYGTPNIPDVELQIWMEASVLPVLVTMLAYIWYRYLDKDGNNVPDFIEDFDDEEDDEYDDDLEESVIPWQQIPKEYRPIEVPTVHMAPVPNLVQTPVPVPAPVQAPVPSPPAPVVGPVNPSGDGTGSSVVTAVVPPVLDPVDLQETLQRVRKLLEVLERG